MVYELALNTMIRSAIAVAARENGPLFFSAYYRDVEVDIETFLQRVRGYLMNHYGLHNNAFNDNDILNILDSEGDELSAFALNIL